MKKFIKVLLVCIMCLGLTACGNSKKVEMAKTIEDVEKIVKENDLKDNGFDNIGLFWKFSFANMDFSVIFDIDETPKDYYVNKLLSAKDIKSIQVSPNKDVGGQWLYLQLKDGKFVVDEDDLEKFSDKGRKEAYEEYQENLKA